MIDLSSYRNIKKNAKKKYGQNFLKDESVISKIIESMPKDKLPIVEIGPGLGDLTRYLVEIKDVTAYEVDRELCEHLRNKFAASLENGKLKLYCGDALQHWKQGGLLKKHYHLVANLPYYIATNIILRALKDPSCKSMLVMVQKEVAEKFSAKPGDREFCALSVLAQSCAEVHICFDVPPEAFVPVPKVMSSVLQIQKRDSFDDPEFEEFLRTAFSQPRKKLAKNLSAVFSKDDVGRALSILGLNSTVRPHEVEASLYHHLNKILKGDIDGRKQKPKARKLSSK